MAWLPDSPSNLVAWICISPYFFADKPFWDRHFDRLVSSKNDYFLHGEALKGTDYDNAAAKRWPRPTNCRIMFGTRKNGSENRMLIISLIHTSFLKKKVIWQKTKDSLDWKYVFSKVYCCAF